ncbi:MAG TPA: hypothetical protein DCM86_13065, partial [Verrucomicrobiales bacterium]|nr:hypothetical protein [Verrucomicrobiales bacterium]
MLSVILDRTLALLARLLIALLQGLPLAWVARIGRTLGGLAYHLDARHRKVAIRNLQLALPGRMTPSTARDCARENFRRIGEGFACLVKTATLSDAELAPHLEVDLPPSLRPQLQALKSRSIVAAIGHFGNFELYARVLHQFPGYTGATTYRGLRQPSLNRLMQSLRERSGCRFYERRTDAGALRAALSNGGVLLGLLADQHAGDRGLPLPLFGRICSTSAAPALFALRYQAPLLVPICYRVGPLRWRIELGDLIPTHTPAGEPRTPEELMAEVTRSRRW